MVKVVSDGLVEDIDGLSVDSSEQSGTFWCFSAVVRGQGFICKCAAIVNIFCNQRFDIQDLSSACAAQLLPYMVAFQMTVYLQSITSSSPNVAMPADCIHGKNERFDLAEL
jgi:hypothetical protein